MIKHRLNNKNEDTSSEMKVTDYFHGSKKVHDSSAKVDVVKIFAGDWYVSRQDNEMLATILGSCVSACIRDPVAKVGGMNHFLLPGNETVDNVAGDAARYGVFAMESLINAILNAGGQRHRLEVKVFGGGNVINNSNRIGSKNAAFVKQFLDNEGLRIVAEDLEGSYARRLHYYPTTGVAMVRVVQPQDKMIVVNEEKRYQTQIGQQEIGGDIELF